MMWLMLTTAVHAFELGETEAQLVQRYGKPTLSKDETTFKTLVYVRSFGRVVILLGKEAKTEAVLQFDNSYGRDYPQLGQFLLNQEPAFSLTDQPKTHSVEIYQQLSGRGFEAWLYKKQNNHMIWVFGDLVCVPYRRDEARSILSEYGRQLLTDSTVQKLLTPVYQNL